MPAPGTGRLLDFLAWWGGNHLARVLQLRKRVRLVLESDHIGVWPDTAARARSDAQAAASGGPER